MSKKYIVSFDIFDVGLFFCITYAFLPLIRITPSIVRAAWRIIPECCLLASVLHRNKKMLTKSYIVTTMGAIYLAIMRSLVYANGIEDSYLVNILNSLLYWHMVVYGIYIALYMHRKKAKQFFMLSVGLASLSSLTTIIGNIVFSGVSRHSSDFSVIDFGYYQYNIGAYAFIYSLVFLCIGCIYLIGKKHTIGDNKRLEFYIGVILFFICIFVSQFMTAFALLLIAMVFMIFLRNKPLHIKLFAVILAVLFVLLSQTLIPLLMELLEKMGFHSLVERIGGLYSLLSKNGGYGDVYARLHLYSISLQYFIKDPLFGLAGYNGFHRVSYLSADRLMQSNASTILAVGQHSDLIDLLGGNGLISVGLFFILLRLYYKGLNGVLFADDDFRSFVRTMLLVFVIYGVFDHSLSCLDVSLTVFVIPSLVFLGFLGNKSV